jgi:hypothetical protein
MKRKNLGKGLGKGYKNILMSDSAVHSLSARGICQKSALVELPISQNIVYHSGLYQNVFDKDHPEKLTKKEKNKLCDEIDNLKSQIAFFIDEVKEHKGEPTSDKEILTIVVHEDKFHHLNFLKAHTDWSATGFWKEATTGKKYDEEENIVLQIEFLDTPSESVGRKLMKLFKRLNQLEIGERALYVRTTPVEESSLPLKEWRGIK